MESIEGITDLRMSGRRAVFLLAPGAKVARAEVAAAFEERGMKLERYGEERLPRASATYVVDAGVT